MVSSPMYERLKVFMEAARSNRDLDAWDTDHKKTLKGFEEAAERLKRYSDNQGFQGQTADAMNQWVAESLHRINMVRSIYEAGHTTYEAGRSTMATALKEAEMISPTLLDSATEAMRDNPVVMVPSSSPGGGVSVLGKRFTTGAAYVDAVEAQANAQREAAAQRVLSMVNERTSHIAALMRQQAQLSEQVKQRTDHPGTVGGEVVKGISQWSYSEDQGFGRAADRSPSSANYPGGFAQPWWSEADAAAAQNRTVASGAIPTQEPAYGELGSRTNPITDPQELMGTDLLHTPANGTAYRNGVVGGHTPAPPADAHHPLWRLNGGAASDSATAGRLGGAGVLGAGALGLRGAARMGSGNLGGSGSLGGSSVFGRFGGSGAGANGLGGSGSAGGMSGAGRMGTAGMRGVTGSTSGLGGAGAAGLKVGSYSGSGFGSYTPPANSAGAGGANGAAGSSGVTGTTGANGGGAAGAAGAAGKGGATSGGFMGAGAGAGAGAGKDDKKGRKNRYVAFKFDDDEDELPAGYVNPLSQTSGTDKDITPAKRNDDGWDPRQW
ncbi:hypothetical protein FOC40_10100 [Schaalia odontolytica]|uniref:PPE family domain-containing protein n=1 Tax=Schaalia odontolytica TaxID=1660 RepID=A0A857AC34_9ACTO|nr:hypothetical protein [Schaalia odontolytica]QGS11718.1 hypothetical protein FOC40_10100 [Schaalia odontolytica]